MSLIDDIKRDSEAGTRGPWFSLPQCGPRVETNFARVFAADDDLRYIADCRDSLNFHSKTDNETNARRIARVPAMEAALLAAEDAMLWLEASLGCPNHPYDPDQREMAKQALSAYRKATEGEG